MPGWVPQALKRWQTKDVFWVQQVTQGIKPIPAQDYSAPAPQVSTSSTLDDFGSEGVPVPAF
jgi:hypothetical protein